MPLIKCPDCGNDVSTLASTCPRCGRPMEGIGEESGIEPEIAENQAAEEKPEIAENQAAEEKPEIAENQAEDKGPEVAEKQAAREAPADAAVDSTGEEILEGSQESAKSAAMPLLIFGGILIAIFALGTDYGGIMTSLQRLTGNAPPTISSEAAIRELFIDGSELFDPHSARFRDLMYTNSDPVWGTVWCGEVNAKNRMGAYVGWHGFMATQSDEGEIEVWVNQGDSLAFPLIYESKCKQTYPAPAKIFLEEK